MNETHLVPMKQFYEGLKKTDPELAKRFPIEGKEVLKIKTDCHVRAIYDFAPFPDPVRTSTYYG